MYKKICLALMHVGVGIVLGSLGMHIYKTIKFAENDALALGEEFDDLDDMTDIAATAFDDYDDAKLEEQVIDTDLSDLDITED